MQKTELQILSTRPLSKQLFARAAIHNILIEEIPFIETDIVLSENIKNKIDNYIQQNLTVIFTSMNAVNAIAKYIKQKLNWNIYCVGNTTKKLIEDHFGANSIASTAGNAEELAELIISEDLKHVVFFCGNQRRDELPSKLKAKNVFVDELVVYNTIETPVLISKNYDGILFLAQVLQKVFSINKVDHKTQLFAIGKTTADAIQQYSENHVIIPDVPGKEDLVKRMIEHYL